MTPEDEAAFCRLLGITSLSPEQREQVDRFLKTLDVGIADAMADATVRGAIAFKLN